jgi:hypothetical protein
MRQSREREQTGWGAPRRKSEMEHHMGRIIGVAVVLLSLSTVANAENTATDSPRYVAPPPTGDPQTTIIGGILMIVNGVIMSEADRRHQPCATFVTGLDRNGFPLFRQACRVPENDRQK